MACMDSTVPEGYKLDRIHESWADFIYDNWSAVHKQKPQSLDMIKDMLKTELAQGVFNSRTGKYI
jgi:hypothetical protein